VQVDPIKPTLKPTRTDGLKLNCNMTSKDKPTFEIIC